MRIGFGRDVHRLQEGRRLILGGVVVPFNKGEAAHSDGDVLIHAVIDALLGAAALGDIGSHFPDSDPAYKDIDSGVLLKKTAAVIAEAGYQISNIDSTVILEKPKLRPHIDGIRENLAGLIGIQAERISVKAKTAEKLGPVGSGDAVEAEAAVLLIRK